MAGVIVSAVVLLAQICHAKAQLPVATYAYPSNGACVDYAVNEAVISTNPIFNTTAYDIQNTFDFTGFLLDSARKDRDEIFHPISGLRNETRNYTVSATFCTPKTLSGSGKEKTVLLASHGIWYDRRYWAPTYKPDSYNFAQYALSKGYSIFYYDRIGTGLSQRVSGFATSQSDQVELLAQIAKSLRAGKYTSTVGNPDKIVMVGHSFGSIISHGALAKYPNSNLADGAILTGISYPGPNDTAKAISQFLLVVQGPRLANQDSDNSAFADRDDGYMSFSDIYSHTIGFFHPPFVQDTIRYAQSIYQPAAVLEFLSAPDFAAPKYDGKVLLAIGEHDVGNCGGECYYTLRDGLQGKLLNGTKVLETYVHPGSGHGVNFAVNATGLFGVMTDFLDRNF